MLSEPPTLILKLDTAVILAGDLNIEAHHDLRFYNLQASLVTLFQLKMTPNCVSVALPGLPQPESPVW